MAGLPWQLQRGKAENWVSCTVYIHFSARRSVGTADSLLISGHYVTTRVAGCSPVTRSCGRAPLSILAPQFDSHRTRTHGYILRNILNKRRCANVIGVWFPNMETNRIRILMAPARITCRVTRSFAHALLI